MKRKLISIVIPVRNEARNTRVIIEVKESNREGVFNFFREVNYECKHIPEDESGKYYICTPKE